MKELYQKIRQITGKPYGLYKQLASKKWDFGDFTLEFLHIQGDPYAPPSRATVTAPLAMLGWKGEFSNTFTQRLALSDFLHRELAAIIQERYPEKNADIIMAVPGQEIMVRNALWVENGNVTACFQVNLPGEKRLINGELLADILTSTLPDLLTAGLYADSGKIARATAAIKSLEMREALLDAARAHGLAAFVPNGAILPRESGISEKPLQNAVPFAAPAELQVELEACGERICGMGIPKGITVITGGAYHGKSTLLSALCKAVYPHIQGDGREWIVVDESAVRVGVEDGRSVRHTDISALVHELPGGKSTQDFSTASASGSTSEASNLLEALEFGAKTVLIDEDASAVNFLVRDARVRALVGDAREPLVPLIDRIKDFAEGGISFIIVAGACGDYLEAADNVILMANYNAECATAKAKEICQGFTKRELAPFRYQAGQSRNFNAFIEELKASVKPTSSVERQVKVKCQGTNMQIGFLTADLSGVAFPDAASRLGAGLLLLNMLQSAEDVPSLKMIEDRFEKIKNVGFRGIAQGLSKDAALPRTSEVAAALLRLRDYGK